MICKYFQESSIPLCLACKRLMVPSVLEQAFYCNGKSNECPVYREKENLPVRKKELQMAGMEIQGSEIKRAGKR